MKHQRILLTVVALLVSIASFAQQAKHVVQRGEDFNSIAEKYNITADELKAANPESGICSVGRTLIIPEHGVAVEHKAAKGEPLNIKLKSEEKSEDMNKTSNFQVGKVMWTRHRYDVAKNYLEDAAKEGDVRAYYPLADCYSQENGGCHDDMKAVDYYEKTVASISDKANDAYWTSCLRLAECNLNGKGTVKDVAKARQYYDEYKASTDKPVTERAKALNKQISSAEKAIEKAKR